MIRRRTIAASCVAMSALFVCLCTYAQEASSPGGIQRKLTAEYSLTKVTSDKTDIVTAGAVLVLEKDNLLMYAVTSEIAPVNT